MLFAAFFKSVCSFEEKNTYVSEGNFIRRYKVMLMQKGLASNTGIINWKKVDVGFLGFFSSDFLDISKSNIMIDSAFTWTKMLLKRKTLVNPIRNILFIEFLFGSLKDIINFKETEYRPFGEGPWPCLNPVAVHYKKDVVTNLEISNRSTADKPFGIFKCKYGY